MTRAEFFVRNGRGRWRVARKPFRCMHSHPTGPCMHNIERDEEYFDTGLVVAVGQRSDNGMDFPKTKRICFKCANQELPK